MCASILNVPAHVHKGNWVAAVAEAVRRELASHEATPTEVAAMLGMSPEALLRRLDASEPFDVSELEWIAGFLGIDVHRIFDSAALIQGEGGAR